MFTHSLGNKNKRIFSSYGTQDSIHLKLREESFSGGKELEMHLLQQKWNICLARDEKCKLAPITWLKVSTSSMMNQKSGTTTLKYAGFLGYNMTI